MNARPGMSAAVPADLPAALRLAVRAPDFPHRLGVFERLFGASLRRKGTCWVRTAAGIPWKLDLRNVTHRWIVYGKYEGGGFLDWAARFVPRDGLIVDSGANIGQMLLYLYTRVPEGGILAFEPGREAADWLQECVNANGIGNVRIIRRALGSERRSMGLHSPEGAHLHGARATLYDDGGERVEVTRLDDELDAAGAGRVDLWKLDVEGHERPALEGAVRHLERHKIRAVYCEMYGDNERTVAPFLSGFGYVRTGIRSDGRLGRPARAEDNALFLSPKEAR